MYATALRDLRPPHTYVFGKTYIQGRNKTRKLARRAHATCIKKYTQQRDLRAKEKTTTVQQKPAPRSLENSHGCGNKINLKLTTFTSHNWA